MGVLNEKRCNKFKSIADFIFIYENYNVYNIKKVCATLNINLDNNDIIDIMIQLESMLNSKKIVEKDDHRDAEYQKTLLSQHQMEKQINLQIYQKNN
jgi:hypothetical protein